jgi:hypothetical protein
VKPHDRGRKQARAIPVLNHDIERRPVRLGCYAGDQKVLIIRIEQNQRGTLFASSF